MARFKKILRAVDLRRILGIADDDKVAIVAVEARNDPMAVFVIVQDETETDYDQEARLMYAPVVPLSGDQEVTRWCNDHKPVQHRDNKPPWCNLCGRDWDGLLWSARSAQGGEMTSDEKRERLNVMVNALLNAYRAPGFAVPDPTRMKMALRAALEAGRIEL